MGRRARRRERQEEARSRSRFEEDEQEAHRRRIKLAFPKRLPKFPILERTCLHPGRSMQTQLMSSFGLTTVGSILCLLAMSILITIQTGSTTEIQGSKIVEDIMQNTLGKSSLYVAAAISKTFDNFGGVGSLLSEVSRDRFVGYPNLAGYANDTYVPFKDYYTQTNIYPLQSDPLVLSWNFSTNLVTEATAMSDVQGRWHWYDSTNSQNKTEPAVVSTAFATYFFQGVCDPTTEDFCDSDLYNNWKTGGAVKPTTTSWDLSQKSADLLWVLKALYESHHDIHRIGVYFANSGAGSNVRFPALRDDFTITYTSLGCDWMNQTNPYDPPYPYATEEEIARCHKAGEVVSSRFYNPLERGWCQKQATSYSPDKPNKQISVDGPYLDASKKDLLVVTFGVPVFDRITGKFIACTLVDVAVDQLLDITQGITVGTTSKVSMARWDDEGTIVVSTDWTPKAAAAENAKDDQKLVFSTTTITQVDVGIDAETFSEMKKLVDFKNTVWDPQEAQLAFTEKVFTKNGVLATLYPIPVIPDVYDPYYHPEYMVIITISEEEVYTPLEVLYDDVEEDVRDTLQLVVIMCCAGIIISSVMICYLASTFTKPLMWMETVSEVIIDNAGSRLGHGLSDIEGSETARPRCTPYTEVMMLVSEFELMMDEFTREGAAEVVASQVSEVKNRFQWRNEYRSVYNAWGASSTGANGVEQWKDDASLITEGSSTYSTAVVRTAKTVVGLVINRVKNYLPQITARMFDDVYESDEDDEYYEKGPRAPPKVNRGRNIQTQETNDNLQETSYASGSRLFWFIVGMVGIPLVVTVVSIGVFLSVQTTRNIDDWLSALEAPLIEFERQAVRTAAIARAAFGQQVMQRVVRDTHVFTRLAGWLLFEGLTRSPTFTEMTTGANICKDYPRYECPFYGDQSLTPCDCAWEDEHLGNERHDDSCTNYEMDTRHLQRRFFEGQASDASNITGNRYSSTYPLVASEPQLLDWWPSIDALPGSEKGANASGFETVYDRVRVLSALALIEMPLYNYNPGYSEPRHLGTYVGMAGDGMMMGFKGCSSTHADYGFWRSTEGNGAAELAPEICPEGKYGYDTRCRSWYVQGKAAGELFISSPYVFASAGGLIASSATEPLYDPVSGGYAGQSLVDFIPEEFIQSVNQSTSVGQTGGIFAIITAEPNNLGEDTLVGPGFQKGQSASIVDVFFPHDGNASEYRANFTNGILTRMRNGETGSDVFTRTSEPNGNKQEDIFVSFAPVFAQTMNPLAPGDFRAGCNASQKLLYSVLVGLPTVDITNEVKDVEGDVLRDVDGYLIAFLVVFFVTACFVAYLTYNISLAVSQPVVLLAEVVRSIRAKTLGDETPEITGGSLEVTKVKESIFLLCQIVRFSNNAFFAGDRGKSCRSMMAALELFETLGNNRALGVASNNLGTLILQKQIESEQSTRKVQFSSTLGMTQTEEYETAMKCFDDAVYIGTKEFESADSNEQKLDYSEQLANRHFNRGMFLIVNRNNPAAPAHNYDNGVQDILKAKYLEEEAVQFWGDKNMNNHVSKQFDMILRRSRGLITLVKNFDFDDVWGIEGLINKAEMLLREESQFKASSSFFFRIGPIARRQQLDDLKIQFHLCKNNVTEAVRLAMRMLVEDEYIVDTIFVNALTTTNKYFGVKGLPKQISDVTQFLNRTTYKSQVETVRQPRNVVLCLDYSGSMAGERISRANENLRWIYDVHCSERDFVGFMRFNHSVDEELFFPLSRKGENWEVQEEILTKAVDATGGSRLYAALNAGVSMAVHCSNPEVLENDTWIIALTDGESSWDHPAKSLIDRITKLNKKRDAMIHIILIGFEVPHSEVATCRAVAGLTEKSLYIDARGGLAEMDKAFKQAALIIRGSAITMEGF